MSQTLTGATSRPTGRGPAGCDAADLGRDLRHRQSHYFRARIADQFDAVIHIDETRAVEPLERTPPGGNGVRSPR